MEVICFFFSGLFSAAHLCAGYVKSLGQESKKWEAWDVFRCMFTLNSSQGVGSLASEVAKEERRVNTEGRAKHTRVWSAAATHRGSPEEHEGWSAETIQSRLWWLEEFFFLPAIFLQWKQWVHVSLLNLKWRLIGLMERLMCAISTTKDAHVNLPDIWAGITWLISSFSHGSVHSAFLEQ